MKRFGVVCVAERRCGMINQVEILHDVNVCAASEADALGVAVKVALERFPGYRICVTQALEILPLREEG